MDIQKAKHEFLKYVSNYDINDFQIKRKLDHSLRVMKICASIANNLDLNQEEKKIATIIGLLHDIARFEQFTKFQTLNDSKSFDHGAYGVEILKHNNFIRNFIEEDKYDELIYKAIKNHNKFQIEDELSERELLFAKIIRDADKLDILYQGTNIFWKNSPKNVEKIENATITEDDIKPFLEKRTVNRDKDLKQVEYNMTHLLTELGFVFDMNFKITFTILNEANYMNQIINRFDFKNQQTKELIEKVRKIVNDYIEING